MDKKSSRLDYFKVTKNERTCRDGKFQSYRLIGDDAYP